MARWMASLLALAMSACGSGVHRETASPPRCPELPSSDRTCPSPSPPPFGTEASFAHDHAELAAHGTPPALLAKLDASAYRYFRLLAPSMAARTCFAFRELRNELPFVAVHGDAHLEQLVVTRETFGIEDFDQAGFGPAVVDVVRYATSLRLACRETSPACDADAAIAVFLREYRAALSAPAERPAPSIVARLRADVPQDQSAWLRWADSLMRPVDEHETTQCRAGMERFAEAEREIHPERASTYYDVVRIGTLSMGIGSALERKILMRIRGPSDAPDDDLVLEARQSQPPESGGCVWRSGHGDSIGTLFFMSLLGSRMPAVYGIVQLDERSDASRHWVQSWDAGYRELSLSDLRTQAEIEEVARDAARQLAGHFWTRFPEPLRALQRRAQLDAFDATSARADVLSRTFAEEVVREWEAYRASPRAD